MSAYHDNLEILADFYVAAATLEEGEEREKEQLELFLFLQKLHLKTTPRGRTIFLSLADLEGEDYPWSTLYPVGEAAPPALILVLNQNNDYVVQDDDYDGNDDWTVDPSRMDDSTRKEWETAVELSEKLATGWLPDEWKKDAADDDDTAIIEDDDEPEPEPTEPKPEPKPAKKPVPPSNPPPRTPKPAQPDAPTWTRGALVATGAVGVAALGVWGLWAAFKEED